MIFIQYLDNLLKVSNMKRTGQVRQSFHNLNYRFREFTAKHIQKQSPMKLTSVSDRPKVLPLLEL